LDLHAVGRRLGQRARRHRDDDLVLAEASGHPEASRAGATPMSRGGRSKGAHRQAQQQGQGAASLGGALGGSTHEVSMRRRRDAEFQVRRNGAALDVSSLASFGFSHRSLMWWSTLGLMAIEGTVFVLAIGAYFYLRNHASRWPMS